jgi:hypothetical protein
VGPCDILGGTTPWFDLSPKLGGGYFNILFSPLVILLRVDVV